MSVFEEQSESFKSRYDRYMLMKSKKFDMTLFE